MSIIVAAFSGRNRLDRMKAVNRRVADRTDLPPLVQADARIHIDFQRQLHCSASYLHFHIFIRFAGFFAQSFDMPVDILYIRPIRDPR
jgi:hypothetical protein